VGYRKEKKEDRVPDPILTLQNARLKAKKVMEKEATEKYAPQVSIWWEIIDDGAEGEHKGKTFWDGHSFVHPLAGGDDWVIREGTRIGDLAHFVAYDLHGGADYFDSDVEIDFEGDLEDVEVIANLEPKRFKPSDVPTGTRTVAGSMQSIERARRAASKILVPDRDDPDRDGPDRDGPDRDDPEWEDIPF
jgi:hypothetical protein